MCVRGGQGLEYWGGARFRILGGQGGPNSQQTHDVVTTSIRRNDVTSTSFRRHVPTRFLINQCQIITFLILKSDIIENSRIELRGIVLPVPSTQIKVTFVIILPFNFFSFCDFYLFHMEIEGKGGWIIWGRRGVRKGYVAPLSQIIGGPGPLLPMPIFLSLIYSTEGLSTHFWIKKILEQSPKIKTLRNVLQSSTVFHSGMFYKLYNMLLEKFFNIRESSRLFLFLLDSFILNTVQILCIETDRSQQTV